MKNLIKGKQPEPIKMHSPLNCNHSINNSKQDRLLIQFHRTKIGTSLHYQGFNLWNDMPLVLESQLYKNFGTDF